MRLNKVIFVKKYFRCAKKVGKHTKPRRSALKMAFFLNIVSVFNILEKEVSDLLPVNFSGHRC